MSDALPEPPVPADADLRHFPDMPLQVQRLRDSGLAMVPDAEVFRASVLSWCVAWHQVPAASLPDDDAALSHMLGYGRDLRRWRSLRAKGALRGWIKCRDGRLYHPVLAESCLRVIAKSRASRSAIMARWSRQGIENKESERYDRITDVIPIREGKGREGNIDTPSSLLRREEGESASKLADPPSPDPEKVRPEVPEAVLFDMVRAWNEMAAAHGLSQVSDLTDKRRTKLRARCRSRWKQDPLKQFRAYCRAIAATPFLLGENDRGWKVTFDVAIRSDDFVLKVAERGWGDGNGS